MARGGTPDWEQWYNVPYVQSYSFNAFGNQTGTEARHWSSNNDSILQEYTNNRLTTGMFNLYDADGRQTRVQALDGGGGMLETKYDAAGQATFFHRSFAPTGEDEITRHYNGNGREEKREKRSYVETEPDEWEWHDDLDSYFIRSTILGGEVVSEVAHDGSKGRTYVRAAGAEIAWQNKSGSNEEVVFQNWDAAGMSYRTANSSGTSYSNFGSEGAPAELDAMGGNVGTENGITQVPGEGCVGCGVLGWEEPMHVNGLPLRFNLDGMDIPLSMGLAFFAGTDFALIQWQANASVREIGRWMTTVSWNESFGVETETGVHTYTTRLSYSFTTSIVYDTSWTVLGSISRFADLFNRVPTDVKGIEGLRIKSNSAGRTLLERHLTGKCADAMQKLIDAISKIKGTTASSILGLFDDLNLKQKYGGIRFDSPGAGAAEYRSMTGGEQQAGRGGAAWRMHPRGTYNINGSPMTGLSDAFVWVMPFTITTGLFRSPTADAAFVQSQITAR